MLTCANAGVCLLVLFRDIIDVLLPDGADNPAESTAIQSGVYTFLDPRHRLTRARRQVFFEAPTFRSHCQFSRRCTAARKIAT